MHIACLRPAFASSMWERERPVLTHLLATQVKTGALFSHVSSFTPYATINAFKWGILDTVLPYQADLDNRSWWYSQVLLHFTLLCRVPRNESILSGALLARNDEHGSYPRRFNLSEPRVVDMIQRTKGTCTNQFF